jgi:hypothetical protein
MANLTNEQKQEVADAAKEHFDGDLQLASAAHVHGFGVVLAVGRQMVEWFAHKQIESVQKQVESFIAGKSKPKAKKSGDGRKSEKVKV